MYIQHTPGVGTQCMLSELNIANNHHGHLSQNFRGDLNPGSNNHAITNTL